MAIAATMMSKMTRMMGITIEAALLEEGEDFDSAVGGGGEVGDGEVVEDVDVEDEGDGFPIIDMYNVWLLCRSSIQ